MQINDLEIALQDNAGNNDNKAVTVVSLSDKEMSTVIGGNDPTPMPTHPAAPPAPPRTPRPEPRVRLGRVWAI